MRVGRFQFVHGHDTHTYSRSPYIHTVTQTCTYSPRDHLPFIPPNYPPSRVNSHLLLHHTCLIVWPHFKTKEEIAIALSAGAEKSTKASRFHFVYERDTCTDAAQRCLLVQTSNLCHSIFQSHDCGLEAFE